MIDIGTIALVLGLADLALAAAATVYFQSATRPQGPLSLWRWARVIGGIAMLLMWLRATWLPLPWLATPTNLLMLGRGVLELAAYLALTETPGWRRPVLAVATLVLLTRLGLDLVGAGYGTVLIYVSLALGGIQAAGAWVLLRRGERNGLTWLIGGTNLIGSLLFFGRAAWGIWVAALVPFQTSVPNMTLWVIGYVITILNGYGFLLLVQQREDRELQQALETLVTAEAEQRKLLSLASHEFRTPAAIIQASLDSLKYFADELSPAVATRLHNIGAATRRLTHLTDVLISQDRLRELRLGLVSRPVDVAALVREVAASYPTPVSCHGYEGGLRMVVDEDLLRIAVHNLIDNALRHGVGERPPHVWLRPVGQGLEVAVADDGPGVPAADQAVIFERFRRGSNSRGCGLGLSIVRTIARLHGGEVSVHANGPRGAVFVLHLPVVPPPVPTGQAQRLVPEAVAQAPFGGNG